MTATPTDADLYGVEHPSAIDLLERLAGATPATRREEATRRLEQRRDALTLRALLLAERFGPAAPTARQLERDDDLAAELLILAVA